MLDFERVISNINDQITDKLPEKFLDRYPIGVDFSSNGWMTKINFMGVCIWDTENDSYDAEGNEIESNVVLEGVLISRIKEIVDTLKTLEFI